MNMMKFTVNGLYAKSAYHKRGTLIGTQFQSACGMYFDHSIFVGKLNGYKTPNKYQVDKVTCTKIPVPVTCFK